MSEYRRALQDALIARRRGVTPPYQRFYTVCEAVGYATLVAAYLLIIAAHI